MHIIHVVGARPNFMKAAPVLRALEEVETQQTLVHTGQHYDKNMSDIFFTQLGIKRPDINLDVRSASHTAQTAAIMTSFEKVVENKKPDMVLVYGDVNSTLAATLVCAKMQIPLGHVEAGLRSFDRSMPEEINRIVTDSLADLHFTPSSDGDKHLLAEGVPSKKIHCVGNVMIDTLVSLLPLAESAAGALLGDLGVSQGKYGLVTLHRPFNVDDRAQFTALFETLVRISESIPLVFPVHPRTQERIKDVADAAGDIILSDPLGYIQFLALQKHASMVITDSGGIQEETTYLKIPCLTLRPNTERPVTVTMGTNTLIGNDLKALKQEVRAILEGSPKQGSIPELWDGHASKRIAEIIKTRFDV